MARIKYSMKILREKYAKGLKRGLLEAIYEAYTQWNEIAYRKILATAPKSKTPSERFPVGFVSSHIKLVTKKRPPYVYREVDVPGKNVRGSRAWRAWIVIRALHEGWTKLPFERRPTRKRALAWRPVIPGVRVSREGKVVRRRAIQRKQIQRNPWIKTAFESLEPAFPNLLNEAIEKRNRRKRKEKVTLA